MQAQTNFWEMYTQTAKKILIKNKSFQSPFCCCGLKLFIFSRCFFPIIFLFSLLELEMFNGLLPWQDIGTTGVLNLQQ
jgi:hypothetical protein